MIFELRLYAVAPGRMNALHARFERLPVLFERHGVETQLENHPGSFQRSTVISSDKGVHVLPSKRARRAERMG